MPSHIKEKERIKGSTCCAFDLQLGPAAPRQTSCYLTPRWEGWTRQRKDDQSHSDPSWDSRLVWANVWVLLGGPCGEQPPFLYLDGGKKPPMKDTLLWKWAAKLLERKKTEVMSICSKLWTLTWTPMGAIWSQQWKYGVGGGSVWTSSEAKPSLTHSRDSWETHPTSKQTYWDREHRAVPSQLSHGGQLTTETWSEWCSETSAPTCWNMTWIHAVILPLIPLWLHSKQTDNSLNPPPPPPRHGNPIWG